MVKGSRLEYDSRHRRHKIHVAPLADNQTFSAVTERSTVTTKKSLLIEKNGITESNDIFFHSAIIITHSG